MIVALTAAAAFCGGLPGVPEMMKIGDCSLRYSDARSVGQA
jgi:hypothetical protein